MKGIYITIRVPSRIPNPIGTKEEWKIITIY